MDPPLLDSTFTLNEPFDNNRTTLEDYLNKGVTTVDPSMLQAGTDSHAFFDELYAASHLHPHQHPLDPLDYQNISPTENITGIHDSAIDLTTLAALEVGKPWVETPTPSDTFAAQDFFESAESSQASNKSSPPNANDLIFSQANSPRDFLRDPSQNTSRETSTDIVASEPKVNNSLPVSSDASWNGLYSNDKMFSFQTPQQGPTQMAPLDAVEPIEKATVYLQPDKTKTRAETQIRMNLILDPLSDRFEQICFPRKTLAKPKLMATDEEVDDVQARGDAVYMETMLVCATAIEEEEARNLALRRARGEGQIPRRSSDKSISDLDKNDPAHPQNGGEVVICEGCRERERKRYDRKKKKQDEISSWHKYEMDRAIMINEKEFKKLKQADSGDNLYSPRAKQVEFAMRITCYCRHQEEKSPVGYRVIFTFKDLQGTLIAQHVSEIFQITDDHKNKDPPPEQPPRAFQLGQQPYIQTTYPTPAPLTIPQMGNYTNISGDGSYTPASSIAAFSQPPTPVMGNFSQSMSPMEASFPNTTQMAGSFHRQMPSFTSTSSSVTAPHFPRPTPQSQARYDAPLISPGTQYPADTTYLPRPVSFESLNFNATFQTPTYQYPNNGFASAPPTPLNLSRPASPTWEQGGAKKMKQQQPAFYTNFDEY